MKFSYLDKRDKNKRLLWFQAYELNYKIVSEAVKIIFKKNVNHNFSDLNRNNLYKVYIEKLLFYDFLEISHKINIFNHSHPTVEHTINIYSSKYISVEIINIALNILKKFHKGTELLKKFKIFFYNVILMKM